MTTGNPPYGNDNSGPAPAPYAPYPGLLLRQKITLIANKYWVHAVDAAGNEGPVVAFAEQKKMKLREEVSFFSDESKSQVLFSFKSRQIIDMHATTDVFDDAGRAIGIFRKDAMKSLLNSTWYLEAAGVNATGTERSQGVALARRFGGMLPVVGDLMDMVPWQFHFDFYDPTGALVMSSERQRAVRDIYRITLPVGGSGYPVDWRVAAAVGVALDAFQGR